MSGLSIPECSIYAAHYIYLAPFAYLHAPTHNRTRLHLAYNFLMKFRAADLRQICLILEPDQIYLLSPQSTAPSLCCPSSSFILTQ